VTLSAEKEAIRSEKQTRRIKRAEATKRKIQTYRQKNPGAIKLREREANIKFI